MVTDKVFNATGTQRIFSSDFAIISDEHLRVYLDNTVVAPTKYDLINNAAVFHTAPAVGTEVTVQVGTTPDDLLTHSPYEWLDADDLKVCSDNIVNINNAADNATTATNQAAFATTKAGESLASAINASDSASDASDSASDASDSASDADDALQTLLSADLVDWTSTGAEVIHAERYTNTTYSNFAGTDAGLVPTSTADDDTKFLRADGTWVVPTDTDTNTGEDNVQSDWSQATTTEDDFIKNKPSIPTALANITDFTSGTGVEVNTALTIGGTKVPKVFVETSAPISGHTAGDLWVDSDGYSSYIAIAIGSGFVWFGT